MTEVEKTQLADLKSTRAQARKVLWANAWGWLAVLAIVAVLTWYVDQRDQQRQHEICGLIIVTDDAYLKTPPTTEVGRNIAAAMHAYRQRLGC